MCSKGMKVKEVDICNKATNLKGKSHQILQTKFTPMIECKTLKLKKAMVDQASLGAKNMEQTMATNV